MPARGAFADQLDQPVTPECRLTHVARSHP